MSKTQNGSEEPKRHAGKTLLVQIAVGIFSAIALVALIRLLNLTYDFFPMSVSGPEGGLIETGLDMMFGSIAALIASVLSVVNLRFSRGRKGAKWLLGWCCLLVLAFVAAFIRDVLGSRGG